MADCLDCLDNLSIEDILKLVTTCDESGNVLWNLYSVTDETSACLSCSQYSSIEDFLRKSLYCEEGKYYIRVKLA